MAELTDNPNGIAFDVFTEYRRVGTNRLLCYDLEVPSGAPGEHGDALAALRSLINKHQLLGLTYLLQEMGYEDGDRVTLAELLAVDPEEIDRAPAFDVADIEREIRMLEYGVGALEPGDVLKVTRVKSGEIDEPDRGVVRDVSHDDYFGHRAEITWNGHTYSVLENNDDHAVRIGRGNMMSRVHDIQPVDPDDVDDETLLEVRERVLESVSVDEQAESLEVDVEKTWQTSGAVEADRATDLHARVRVSGPLLDEPVSVHCRNVFDFGWTASVEADLDDDVEAVVTAAARNNSPIPTGPRL